MADIIPIEFLPPRDVIPFLLLCLASAIGVLRWMIDAEPKKKFAWGDRRPKDPCPDWLTIPGVCSFFAIIIIAGAMGAFE